ncbi:hypothetical protein NYO98_10535 [Nocardioides sp. STR2]|uniref:Uncharacterized protein n=1 Tax=Nocardioides pini TaxID=2975053 RepID=A0ABT4CCN0_9ACTN|nr:hypothetical protein [Nocardioides pini]MCY4726715.1 hypothetical protein [Nocardioides pini]
MIGSNGDLIGAAVVFIVGALIFRWGFRQEFPNGIRAATSSNARGRSTRKANNA